MYREDSTLQLHLLDFMPRFAPFLNHKRCRCNNDRRYDLVIQFGELIAVQEENRPIGRFNGHIGHVVGITPSQYWIFISSGETRNFVTTGSTDWAEVYNLTNSRRTTRPRQDTKHPQTTNTASVTSTEQNFTPTATPPIPKQLSTRRIQMEMNSVFSRAISSIGTRMAEAGTGEDEESFVDLGPGDQDEEEDGGRVHTGKKITTIGRMKIFIWRRQWLRQMATTAIRYTRHRRKWKIGGGS